MVKVSLACVLMITACSAGADPDAFIGTWQYGPGSVRTSSCEADVDLTGEKLFVHTGTKSDLLMGSTECPVDLTIDGDIASAAQNSCMQAASSGMGCRTHVFTSTLFPLTLVVDGSTMTLDEQWTRKDQDTCGTRFCLGTITGTLIKVN
jgi:hypothetical protein